MTRNPDLEFAQRLVLGLISAVGNGDEEAIKDNLEVLAREFGLASYLGAVVGTAAE